ncbi:MAG: phenylalanine--tRNA ligase subunit alpha [Odoribacteraceae bacterium]|jgi:phenylalanyl-tRNA synthetase alpha chain|nr:phenylalanine--tRNA ligase subunit alpha [Odoribacteraceae bacterium]
MVEKIQQLHAAIVAFRAASREEIEQFRVNFLGKKGSITTLFDDFKSLPAGEKRTIGQALNDLKTKAKEKLDAMKTTVEDTGDHPRESLDASRPGFPARPGSRHPLSLVRNEILEIFNRMGFAVSEGPEIEDDWHNFSALNFPEEHPARDMQDTFFASKSPDILLRTHTSSVQVRDMESHPLPLRLVTPGRVFRNEAISARAHCIFHQVEALYIDKDVSFADLKQTLDFFAREFFGPSTRVRLRPSFFPFTEPSAEMDVSCSLCGGTGCNVCKGTGWLEIMGCGMVDPNVLDLNGIDKEVYSGFALGMGIERVAMLKHGIRDLRLFFENDVRFLEQFTAAGIQ